MTSIWTKTKFTWQLLMSIFKMLCRWFWLRNTDGDRQTDMTPPLCIHFMLRMDKRLSLPLHRKTLVKVMSGPSLCNNNIACFFVKHVTGLLAIVGWYRGWHNSQPVQLAYNLTLFSHSLLCSQCRCCTRGSSTKIVHAFIFFLIQAPLCLDEINNTVIYTKFKIPHLLITLVS
jgi:hypothetical protein